MANISNSCPPVVNYTLEEQQEVDRIRQEVDSILLDRFLIDYGNLRENIRICNE